MTVFVWLTLWSLIFKRRSDVFVPLYDSGPHGNPSWRLRWTTYLRWAMPVRSVWSRTRRIGTRARGRHSLAPSASWHRSQAQRTVRVTCFFDLFYFHFYVKRESFCFLYEHKPDSDVLKICSFVHHCFSRLLELLLILLESLILPRGLVKLLFIVFEVWSLRSPLFLSSRSSPGEPARKEVSSRGCKSIWCCFKSTLFLLKRSAVSRALGLWWGQRPHVKNREDRGFASDRSSIEGNCW